MADTPRSIFGEILLTLRTKKGISQEVLADKSNLSRDFISKLENGLRTASGRTIAKLAPNFQLTPPELYSMWLEKMKRKGLYDTWTTTRGQ